MTKKQTAIYNRYLRNNPTTLQECYAKPSYAKQRAYNDCLKRCAEMNGSGFCIMGFNSMMFSVAWMYLHPEHGMCLHYETNRSEMNFKIEF